MPIKFKFRPFLTVVFCLAFQIFFLRDISIGSYAFCFIYLWPIVKAPLDVPPILFVIFAFILGWFVDIFYNTHGMHAAACLVIAFLRPSLINVLTPANGYDDRSNISLKEMSWLWYLPFVFIILLAHHLILFLLEASDTSLIWMSLIRSVFSAVLGLLVFLTFELFDKKEFV